MQSKSGLTLIELLIVLTLLGIVTVIAVPLGTEFLQSHRSTGGFRQFYGDLQQVRIDALSSQGSGAGVRFLSETTYRTFEFEDLNGNGTYEVPEEANAQDHTLEGVKVSLQGTTDPSTGEALLFTSKGLAFSAGGGLPNRTYVVRAPGDETGKCVSIDRLRFREGGWDGSNCN